MGRETRGRLFLAAVWWMACSAWPASGADNPLILGVHPYLPAAEIQSRFAPLAGYLTQVMGRRVEVRSGGSYDEHIEAVGKDQIDIAFLGPVQFVLVTQRFGQKPTLAAFAVKGKPLLQGVIVTRIDSPIRTLAELADKRFAFGDSQSTMGHYVPRYMLMEAGIDRGLPKVYEYLGAHKNVALAVLSGDVDAGALKQEIFDELAPKGLRALAQCPGTPDHLFVTRADMPPLEVARLRDALLRLKEHPQGLSILSNLHQELTALIPVSPSDYDPLRKIVAALEAMDD